MLGGSGNSEMPSSIGRYRVQSLLGVGGMGSVYLAHDENLRRPVAVKTRPGGMAKRSAAMQPQEHAGARLRRALACHPTPLTKLQFPALQMLSFKAFAWCNCLRNSATAWAGDTESGHALHPRHAASSRFGTCTPTILESRDRHG